MKLEEALRILALLACIFITAIDLAFDITGYVSLAICTVLMCVVFSHYRHTPLGAILLFSGTSLYIVAYAALLSVGATVNIAWFSLFILVGYLLLTTTIDPVTLQNRGQAFHERLPSTGNLILIPIILSAAYAFLTFAPGEISELLIGTGWAVSLVLLERLQWSTTSAPKRLGGAVIILAYLLIYSALHWNGGGRLGFISLLLAPVLLVSYYGPWRLSGFVLAGMGAGLVFIGRVMRSGISDGLAGVAEDSGATHVGLTSELWRFPSTTGSATNLLEQYILFFANWIPRAWWPGKPLGVNYVFVDVYFGREGLGEEHSTALGYFGEHIYYSQHLWFFGVALTTITVILLRRLLTKLGGPYITPVLMLDVWMLTLFWGGMAVFASRFWFSVFPTLGFILLMRWKDRREYRRSAGTFLASGPQRQAQHPSY